VRRARKNRPRRRLRVRRGWMWRVSECEGVWTCVAVWEGPSPSGCTHRPSRLLIAWFWGQEYSNTSLGTCYRTYSAQGRAHGASKLRALCAFSLTPSTTSTPPTTLPTMRAMQERHPMAPSARSTCGTPRARAEAISDSLTGTVSLLSCLGPHLDPACEFHKRASTALRASARKTRPRLLCRGRA
jgi:hypothetical protein